MTKKRQYMYHMFRVSNLSLFSNTMKKPKKRFKRKVKDAKIRPNRNWKNRKKKTS